jgi:hypothetical protein
MQRLLLLDDSLGKLERFIGLTHMRTEGRGPIWGSDFTTKPLNFRGIQSNSLLGQTQASCFCLRACVRDCPASSPYILKKKNASMEGSILARVQL